jgi:DNA mismatch repair ATPase MutS
LAQLSPDKARNPDKTVSIIREQLQIAAMGVQSKVTNLSTENGVKDSIAEFWIPQLIQKANKEQHDRIDNEMTRDRRLNAKLTQRQARDLKIEIKKEIQRDLIQWLITQPKDHYQSLPASSGVFFWNIITNKNNLKFIRPQKATCACVREIIIIPSLVNQGSIHMPTHLARSYTQFYSE